MKCPRCQHENRAGARFREECAAPLARRCANCGGELSPTAKFCPECAHPTGIAATPAPESRFTSPLKTFNVSSAAAIVAAACGLYVARHAARAISSNCGAVDVVEALGVNVESAPELSQQSIERAGISST